MSRPGMPAALPFLGLGLLALLAGLWGGLALLGLVPVAIAPALPAMHGLLMAQGFLGTVIALERAVALRRAWGYLAPVAAGLGAVALAIGLDFRIGGALLLLGGAVFVAVYAALDRIEPTAHLRIQAAGALAWVAADLVWLAGAPVEALIPWLAAFLVLTIVGERLELSRAVRLSAAARALLVGLAAVLLAGAAASLVSPGAGTRLAGLALAGLAAWLAAYDAARRTVALGGVTRFIASSLLVGYAWLFIAGVLCITTALAAGPAYDAGLHAVFLGFVISMVFGHAPVIVPSLIRRPLPYRRRFYGHLGLLHAGLLLRLLGGDLAGWTWAWQAGGVLNVLALLVFIGSSAWALVEGARARGPRAAAIPWRAGGSPG